VKKANLRTSGIIPILPGMKKLSIPFKVLDFQGKKENLKRKY
jgi:hypothetical protein